MLGFCSWIPTQGTAVTNQTAIVPPQDLAQQVSAALREDIGTGDVTAKLVPAGQQARGHVITREAAVLCGQPWVAETFRQLAPSIELAWLVAEGAHVAPGDTLLRFSGPARPLLTGERTALNFLQLLSATATAASHYAQAVAGTGCIVLDTRKTIPGLRTAQKYAVRVGGAGNHRIGLYDMVLIKENHIIATGSIGAAIAAARTSAPHVRVETEVENLDELEQAFAARPDIVLLDNFSTDDLRRAVQRNRELGAPVKLEASGNASLQTLRAIAETGVDYVSVGAITKHVQAVDLSMRLQFV